MVRRAECVHPAVRTRAGDGELESAGRGECGRRSVGARSCQFHAASGEIANRLSILSVRCTCPGDMRPRKMPLPKMGTPTAYDFRLSLRPNTGGKPGFFWGGDK